MDPAEAMAAGVTATIEMQATHRRTFDILSEYILS
jgi:hypothetical protein